jgi:uncharacterized protein involved in outer membrane biogenesis
MATGYSPSTMIATLAGSSSLAVADGAISGFDLFRLKRAVENAEPKSAEAAVNEALRIGTTGFDRLDMHAALAHGEVSLDGAQLIGAAGQARFTGGFDLANQTLDVSMVLQPSVPNPPAITLRLSGPIDRPQRTPELAGFARWLAELVR